MWSVELSRSIIEALRPRWLMVFAPVALLAGIFCRFRRHASALLTGVTQADESATKKTKEMPK
jgi:hypothetical protein